MCVGCVCACECPSVCVRVSVRLCQYDCKALVRAISGQRCALGLGSWLAFALVIEQRLGLGSGGEGEGLGVRGEGCGARGEGEG